MSRIFVTDDADTVRVEVYRSDAGYAEAVCEALDWRTDPGRRDGLHDVIEEAGIHLDLRH